MLTHAYTPDDPRWDVMSVQGTVADRLGDTCGDAILPRRAQDRAGRTSVLTNMGLSLALAKQLPEAEDALRQAVASPKADARMRGDLALVLALEGKFSDAETVGQATFRPTRRAPMSRRSADDRAERFLARPAQARKAEAEGAQDRRRRLRQAQRLTRAIAARAFAEDRKPPSAVIMRLLAWADNSL